MKQQFSIVFYVLLALSMFNSAIAQNSNKSIWILNLAGRNFLVIDLEAQTASRPKHFTAYQGRFEKGEFLQRVLSLCHQDDRAYLSRALGQSLSEDSQADPELKRKLLEGKMAADEVVEFLKLLEFEEKRAPGVDEKIQIWDDQIIIGEQILEVDL